ncbi:uncharacterized protein [Watersipora subatra]|uniref:uncharacterized protein n=1 Tax=Watersipora subatra TaxID=2589382 RepID=UPI00355AD22E
MRNLTRWKITEVVDISLQKNVLQILHLGHFGMERMKKLARTEVYWPRIDADIEDTCRQCTSCEERQRLPQKVVPILMRMLQFGRELNLCSRSETKKSQNLVENRVGQELKRTNGAAERLVQTFKQALKKSELSPKAALQQFLMQYRRIPLLTGFSPSQLLNGRQIRCKIDTLRPSPAHLAQLHQSRVANQATQFTDQSHKIAAKRHIYSVGDACYACYYGPKQVGQLRWVPAKVTKLYETRSVNVKAVPNETTWRHHVEQLQRKYSTDEDGNPGEKPKMSKEPQPSVPVPHPARPDPVVPQHIPTTRRNQRRNTDSRLTVHLSTNFFSLSKRRQDKRLNLFVKVKASNVKKTYLIFF